MASHRERNNLASKKSYEKALERAHATEYEFAVIEWCEPRTLPNSSLYESSSPSRLRQMPTPQTTKEAEKLLIVPALSPPPLFFILVLEHIMSLEQALEVLEFKSLEDVDVASLKASFKRLALTEHPDKGGSQFDSVLSAYTFLSGVLRRQTGGRDKAAVLHPEDVLQARESQYTEEMAILVNEVLDGIQREEQSEFCRVFNAQWEEYKAKEEGKIITASEERGHSDWLASEEKSVVSFLPDGEYGPFTMAPPIMKEESLHTLFEYTARCGKPPVMDVALLPDQMARRISCGGMSLVSSATDSFTSDVLERPEYTDVLEAFTKENTLVDKLPAFQDKVRTFEDLLKERDIRYKTEEDRDLEAVALYERVYQEQEREHKKRIEAFFASTGASSWALPSASASASASSMVSCHTDKEKRTTFVITLGS